MCQSEIALTFAPRRPAGVPPHKAARHAMSAGPSHITPIPPLRPRARQRRRHLRHVLLERLQRRRLLICRHQPPNQPRHPQRQIPDHRDRRREHRVHLLRLHLRARLPRRSPHRRPPVHRRRRPAHRPRLQRAGGGQPRRRRMCRSNDDHDSQSVEFRWLYEASQREIDPRMILV